MLYLRGFLKLFKLFVFQKPFLRKPFLKTFILFKENFSDLVTLALIPNETPHTPYYVQ